MSTKAVQLLPFQNHLDPRDTGWTAVLCSTYLSEPRKKKTATPGGDAVSCRALGEECWWNLEKGPGISVSVPEVTQVNTV